MTSELKHCMVKGCDNDHRARGYCGNHYRSIYFIKQRPLHYIWTNIKSRCNNSRHPRYKDWGGRGIKLHPEWAQNYHMFAKGVGARPSPFHQLDRIDNNGNYEPGNVRWVTAVIQGQNRRIRRTSTTGVKGVEYRPKQGYVARITVNKKRLYLGTFKSLEDAATARVIAQQKYFA